MRTAKHITGPAGEAWLCSYELEDQDTPDQAATQCVWLIHAPGQSLMWSFYLLACVHLREMKGVKPAKLQFPGATHEVLLGAIDPEMGIGLRPENLIARRDALIKEHGRGYILRPMNYVHQFGDLIDSQAVELVDLFAWLVVNSRLPAEPPLSGGDYWTHTLLKIIEHLTTGHRIPFEQFDVQEGQSKSRRLSS